jgi:hypothetical protein
MTDTQAVKAPEVCTRCWTVKSRTGECVCDALDRK